MKDLKVEEALARLEAIVNRLEAEEADLETTLALFEEGVQLAERIQEKLRSGELKLKQVLEDATGFALEDFSV